MLEEEFHLLIKVYRVGHGILAQPLLHLLDDSGRHLRDDVGVLERLDQDGGRVGRVAAIRPAPVLTPASYSRQCAGSFTGAGFTMFFLCVANIAWCDTRYVIF